MKTGTLGLIATLVLAPVLATGAPAEAADTYTLDPVHSEISFQIRHFVTKVRGHFRDYSVTLVKDDANPANSSVELRIDAASIDTNHERRDADLRSENFFWVEEHPEITFRSTAIEQVSDREYRVTGPLTIRGITKVISLPVTLDGEMPDGSGGLRVGFSTSTRLDRKEFGIVWNRALDSGGFMLGDEVDVTVTLAMRRQ
jgi:polyisoprenoid-binding protein YceI